MLVAFLKDDYELERIVDWDVLGMRGTCSTGFTLRGKGDVEQILPAAYEKIHTQSMVPVAHLTWSGVWTGIAAGAVGRARRFVRGAAPRQRPAAAGRCASDPRRHVAAGIARQRGCSFATLRDRLDE